MNKLSFLICLIGFTLCQCTSKPTYNLDGVAIKVPDKASREEVTRLAVEVRPSYRQLDYQQREMLGFIHIGMNTFTGKEWGTGLEDPAIFNPTQLDARQWVKTFKDAGITGVILVAKHHDGFCVWPTAYTNHNVSRSPWRDGKGDLVKEVSDACHEFGMKLCIYLSPWDMHEPSYGTPSYNDFYIHQLEELLTDYGPVYLLWFDGAGVDSKVSGKNMPFDWERIFKRARELQPDVLLSGAAPDIRWVGNEGGRGRETEWSVQGITAETRLFGGNSLGYDPMAKNLGSIDDLMGKKQLVWYPSRGGLPLRKGWFWNPHDDNTTKSLHYLVDSYFSTIGQNSNLLPNLSPDTLGLIPEKDANRLIEFGKIIMEMKETDMAVGATATAVSGWKGKTTPAILFDHDPFTCWHTADGTTQATAEIELAGEKTFNVIKLQENVRDFGQRVEKFAVDAWLNGQWEEIAQSTTIGFRKMLRLKNPVTTEKLCIRFLEARVSVSFSNLSLYYLVPLRVETVAGEENNIDRKGWKIMVSGLNKAGNIEAATDGQTNTCWQFGVKIIPCEWIIDTGKEQPMNSFIYTPATEGQPSHVEEYAVSCSKDGKNWSKPVTGRFGNIVNNPVEQHIPFPTGTIARFVKFVIAKTTSNTQQVSVAEINITQ